MNIVIYGHDYPALVTAASLASNGNQVTLLPVDASSDWVWQDTARKQAGLSALIETQQATGRLVWGDVQGFSEYANSHVHILSLSSAKADLTDALVQQLSLLLREKTLLVTQTLHGVGRADVYQQRLKAAQSPAQVVVWPEFLSEGSAIAQFSRPDRIIIGTDSDWAINRMRDLLRPYNRARDMLLIMKPAAAEMTKYAINTLLALRVSAMNEFANLAGNMGVDIEQVRQGIGTDPRIGFNYLFPGAGFGGSHFMAELDAVRTVFQQSDLTPHLLMAALRVNSSQQEILFHKAWKYFSSQLDNKVFALWGASYKPGTATIDKASSLKLIDALLAQGVTIRVHDPKALSELNAYYGDHDQLILCDNKYAACEKADALFVMTEWDEYWAADIELLAKKLNRPLIFDGRNIFDPYHLATLGFEYIGVGRSNK